MKCQSCGRNMKSTKQCVVEIYMAGVVVCCFKFKMCRTCRKKKKGGMR